TTAATAVLNPAGALLTLESYVILMFTDRPCSHASTQGPGWFNAPHAGGQRSARHCPTLSGRRRDAIAFCSSSRSTSLTLGHNILDSVKGVSWNFGQILGYRPGFFPYSAKCAAARRAGERAHAAPPAARNLAPFSGKCGRKLRWPRIGRADCNKSSPNIN